MRGQDTRVEPGEQQVGTEVGELQEGTERLGQAVVVPETEKSLGQMDHQTGREKLNSQQQEQVVHHEAHLECDKQTEERQLLGTEPEEPQQGREELGQTVLVPDHQKSLGQMDHHLKTQHQELVAAVEEYDSVKAAVADADDIVGSSSSIKDCQSST